MSQGSDKNNSSDDLIAELARLMASDAKGGQAATPEATPVEASTPALDTSASFGVRADEPQEPAPYLDADQFASPEVPSAPAPEFTPLPQSQSYAEPVDFQQPARVAEPFSEPASQTASQDQDASQDHAPQVAAPRFAAPASDAFAEPPAPSAPQKDPFDFDLPEITPLADVNFGDDALDQSHAATSAFQTPEPEAAYDSAPEAVDADPYAPEPQSTQPDDVDPIAALIAAQLNEADSVQPGMIKTDYAPRQDRSFGRASSDEVATSRDESIQDFGAPRASRSETYGLPKASRDPLDDIESLIGAALRGDKMSAPAPEPVFRAPSTPEASATDQAFHEPAFQEPAPTTTAAPYQPAALGAAESAEAAIMAATASMQGRGQSAGFDAYGDARGFNAQSDASAERGERTKNSSSSKRAWKKYAGPAVAAALLVSVAIGVYWVFGTNNQIDGDAPVLSADTAPVKQAPEIVANNTPSSVVFSDTATDAPDTIERLISRDETADAAGNDVSRVITSEAPDDGGLANRKVRTVTVRPDGTIVSGDAAVAGGEQLPVERPNVPQLPGSSLLTSPLDTAAATTPAANTNLTPDGLVAPVPQPRPSRSATSTASTPGASITPTLTSSNNTNAVDLIANAANRAVSAPAAPLAQPSIALASGSAAPAYVQLSSQRNPEAAQQSLQRVQSRFATQLGNNPLEVQQVDLGERGIFYRVRMPAQSVETANAVCSDIKSGGGDCFVRTD